MQIENIDTLIFSLDVKEVDSFRFAKEELDSIDKCMQFATSFEERERWRVKHVIQSDVLFHILNKIMNLRIEDKEILNRLVRQPVINYYNNKLILLTISDGKSKEINTIH